MTNQEQTQTPDAPAPENEDNPALAEEQPDTPAPENETPDTHEDFKGDERAQKAAAEAKRYRLQLREAQAELEAARATVSELEETLIKYLGKEIRLEKPEALIKAGFNGEKLRDENGALLPLDQLAYNISQFASGFGLAFRRGTPMPPDPSQMAEALGGDTWEDSFRMH